MFYLMLSAFFFPLLAPFTMSEELSLIDTLILILCFLSVQAPGLLFPQLLSRLALSLFAVSCLSIPTRLQRLLFASR